ncbi:A24 family peptidase [Streptomyces sp. NPDC001868]|uniref:A24 family peptidase n=1 Tax=Streptomyces sp. NPDC001868 TaxID=3154401 RepID=UPI00331A9A70
METLWITVGAGLWGGGAGLLVPRAGYRLCVAPGEPWRAVCPAGHAFTGPGNGWLGRARCAGGDPYGPSTPLLVAASVMTCAVLAYVTGARPELLVWLLLAPVGMLLAVVDFTAHRLPDVLTLPLAPALLVLLGVAALSPDAGGSWATALLGSIALSGGFVVLFLCSPRSVGFGDVKLALALGVVLGWHGWGSVLVGSFVGFLLFSLYGVGLILAGRTGRTMVIPVGPFALAGALTGVLLGSFAW